MTAKTTREAGTEALTKAVASVYPKENVVKAEFLECVLKEGVYKSRVKIEFKGANASKKVTTSTFLLENPKTKELKLSKLENGKRTLLSIPLPPTGCTGPWCDPYLHSLLKAQTEKCASKLG